jgi:hypothetical protein
MADKQQTAIGGTTTVPANGSATVAHESDGGEFINLIEYVGSASGLEMDLYVRPQQGKDIPLVTAPDDGPDSTQGGNYPITVPNSNGDRFLTLVRLDQGDQLVFEFKNTTTADEDVTAFASAAYSLNVALSNGGA